MKQNLWKRLRPELKTVLEERYKDMPNTLNEIRQELENQIYYNNLEYWVYSDLRFLTKQAFGEIDMFLANYFLPE